MLLTFRLKNSTIYLVIIKGGIIQTMLLSSVFEGAIEIVFLWFLWPVLMLSLVAFYIITIIKGKRKAMEKGYSDRLGTLLTVFLFFIGYIILCLLKERVLTGKFGLESHWRCKYCGAFNNQGNTICTSCGKDAIKHHETKQKEVDEEDESKYIEKWTCSKCGQLNNAHAKNCINCFEHRPRKE